MNVEGFVRWFFEQNVEWPAGIMLLQLGIVQVERTVVSAVEKV